MYIIRKKLLTDDCFAEIVFSSIRPASYSESSADRVVFPLMVDGLVQTAIEIIQFQTIRFAEHFSLSQFSSWVFRCDRRLPFVFAEKRVFAEQQTRIESIEKWI